jgi:streptomycin 6-kinase
MEARVSTTNVPDAVRQRAIAAGREEWLTRLPEIVASLKEDWAFRAGRVLGGGSEALVVETTLRDGQAAVLKVLMPRDDDSARHEFTTLKLASGIGCARLLRADVERSVMLLERLGPALAELGLPSARRREVLCGTARNLWRPAAGYSLPTGAEKGRWLVEFITSEWESLGRPCSAEAVAYALACARRRIAAHDDERAVLVHGDIHERNTLQADSGFKLIDPDGLLAEPEYDLGVIMREDPVEPDKEDPLESARWLALRTGRDTMAIWEWATVERLSTALVCTRLGYEPTGQRLLQAAERAPYV